MDGECLIEEALEAAIQAVKRSTNFGFGWAHIAELEFCRARINKALENLDRSLDLTGTNVQAFALQWILLVYQNKVSETIGAFQRAMAIDGILGNAWLGCGLCRMRQGEAKARLEDVIVATGLELLTLLWNVLLSVKSAFISKTTTGYEIDTSNKA